MFADQTESQHATPKVSEGRVHHFTSSSTGLWSVARFGSQSRSGVHVTSDLASPPCCHYIIRRFPQHWSVSFNKMLESFMMLQSFKIHHKRCVNARKEKLYMVVKERSTREATAWWSNLLYDTNNCKSPQNKGAFEVVWEDRMGKTSSHAKVFTDRETKSWVKVIFPWGSWDRPSRHSFMGPQMQEHEEAGEDCLGPSQPIILRRDAALTHGGRGDSRESTHPKSCFNDEMSHGENTVFLTYTVKGDFIIL